MDNKAYLEKIASENRPLKPVASGFLGKLGFSPKMKKLLIGGAVAAILIIIIGLIAGSGNQNSERDLVDKLSLRTDNLISSIDDYNRHVKSSALRSMANSLRALLTQANYVANTSLSEDFEDNSGKPAKEQTATDEEAWLTDLNTSLENARLNGLLDRTYSRELAYQISMLITLENDIIKKTNKDSLRSTLEASANNLDQLHTQFDNFTAE